MTVAETRGGDALAFFQDKAILIVYDESEVATMLAEMLAVHGHRVETAGNGVIALGKPRLWAYDVLLSDLRMPTLDGSNLYR